MTLANAKDAAVLNVISPLEKCPMCNNRLDINIYMLSTPFVMCKNRHFFANNKTMFEKRKKLIRRNYINGKPIE